MYAYLDKLMERGLPWKREIEGGQRLSRSEMNRMKVDFRRWKGETGEMDLISMLSTLDNTHVRADPPYQATEDALRRMWEAEWREHGTRRTSKPRRLHDCIKLLR
jgi:hypothetical protein